MDWFRRTAWASNDRLDFEARLSRARRHNRAQYLRIQAAHLEGTGKPELIAEALGLLERMLRDYPDRIERAPAHSQRARCLAQLGRVAEALDAYRAALAQEREFPNVITNAWLDFGWLALTKGLLESRAAEVDAILREREGGRSSCVFPAHEYMLHTLRALLAALHGSEDAARAHARQALTAARAARSRFARHPHVGLVHTPDERILQRLRALAGEAPD